MNNEIAVNERYEELKKIAKKLSRKRMKVSMSHPKYEEMSNKLHDTFDAIYDHKMTYDICTHDGWNSFNTCWCSKCRVNDPQKKLKYRIWKLAKINGTKPDYSPVYAMNSKLSELYWG